MKLIKGLIVVIIASISFTSIAQEKDKKMGIISGKVQDARTKKPLNEAVVTLSSDAFTGQKLAITDSTGNYRINNLPKGFYSVTFEMEGYKKFVQDSIKLQEGMSLGISFQMIRDRKEKNNSQKSEQTTNYKAVISRDSL